MFSPLILRQTDAKPHRIPQSRRCPYGGIGAIALALLFAIGGRQQHAARTEKECMRLGTRDRPFALVTPRAPFARILNMNCDRGVLVDSVLLAPHIVIEPSLHLGEKLDRVVRRAVRP